MGTFHPSLSGQHGVFQLLVYMKSIEPPENIDRGLPRAIGDALAFAFECFGDGDHDPFVKLTETSGTEYLVDLQSADGTISESLLDAGREFIQGFAKSGLYYVLVWDGYLTKAGERHDAVFAEAGARGEAQAVVFAQRYKEAKSGALTNIGDPLIAANAAHLWKKTHAE